MGEKWLFGSAPVIEYAEKVLGKRVPRSTVHNWINVGVGHKNKVKLKTFKQGCFNVFLMSDVRDFMSDLVIVRKARAKASHPRLGPD